MYRKIRCDGESCKVLSFWCIQTRPKRTSAQIAIEHACCYPQVDDVGYSTPCRHKFKLGNDRIRRNSERGGASRQAGTLPCWPLVLVLIRDELQPPRSGHGWVWGSGRLAGSLLKPKHWPVLLSGVLRLQITTTEAVTACQWFSMFPGARRSRSCDRGRARQPAAHRNETFIRHIRSILLLHTKIS